MGTEFRIILYAADKALADKAANAAFQRVAQLNDIMSDYDKTSELMQLCAKAGGLPVKVSDDLFDVLYKSKKLSELTDGAFDVTIGPVVRLWRKARRTRTMPDDEALKAALSKVGHEKIVLDPVMRTVRLMIVGMLLDLGGIAKGYAADAILEVLRRFGIRCALVAASGDIRVGDPPPGEKHWKIGIGQLRDPSAEPKVFIYLCNAAVSTSGDVEQYALISGTRYSHIVNPKTGIGLVGRSSMTVIAPTATESDSLATAVSVMNVKKGLELLRNCRGTAGYFVVENAQGKLETVRTDNFADFEKPKELNNDD